MGRQEDEARFMARFGQASTVEEFLRAFLAGMSDRFFFAPDQRSERLALLYELQAPECILAEAERILRHEVDLLGSGCVSLGDKIDWHQDFKSGRRWNPVFYADIDYVNAGEPSDVKVAWELSRFHYLAWLGKAYWATQDERFAAKFQGLIEDWLVANPFPYGVNWTVAMEVAIRACNWILALGFFGQSRAIPAEFWLRMIRSLYQHAVFIRYNLEYGRLPTNHYIADGAGLVFLGILFRSLPEGRRWLALGMGILEDEIQRQVHPDGVDFEKSISYHRLMLEFFYASYILAAKNGMNWSMLFMHRLERMFEFTLHYTKPNGLVPLVSDADNGRLFRFSAKEDFNDHRHALAVGAVVYRREDMRGVASRYTEDAVWLLGSRGRDSFRMLGSGLKVTGSMAFPQGGYFVLRDSNTHMFIDAGVIAPSVRGVHGHNDTLSFELCVGSETFVTDSGTFAYTGDEEAHRQHSCTRAHNTVVVDGCEVAEFQGMWRIVEDRTRPRVLQWVPCGDPQILEVEHYGYTRLADPVVHRRQIRFSSADSRWVITDSILGQGHHRCEMLLHLGPGIQLARESDRRVVLIGQEAKLIAECNGPVTIETGWVAPSYGVRLMAPMLTVTKAGPVPLSFETCLSVMPLCP